MIFLRLWDTANMDLIIVLGIKLILQQSGVEIKPAKDKDGKYARLTEYIFPHNRLVKLVIDVYYSKII